MAARSQWSQRQAIRMGTQVVVNGSTTSLASTDLYSGGHNSTGGSSNNINRVYIVGQADKRPEQQIYVTINDTRYSISIASGISDSTFYL